MVFDKLRGAPYATHGNDVYYLFHISRVRLIRTPHTLIKERERERRIHREKGSTKMIKRREAGKITLV